jgi:transcriptional regulator with XRE-family HTH domain
MFGANLRQLTKDRGSISALSRELGINRTQFNRYLSGESFPRPDVLGRICAFFDVDARVLLDPVDEITQSGGPISGQHMAAFMGTGVTEIPDQALPNGFYQFSRRSFVDKNRFVRGLVMVHRIDGNAFIKGYEPKDAMAMQGIPTQLAAREYRGFVLQLDDGIAATVCRRNGLTASFNFLTRVTSFENNFWVGYVARTVAETPTSLRMSRLVYEFIGKRLPSALRVARHAGFCSFEELLPFHQRLLQPDAPFR